MTSRPPAAPLPRAAGLTLVEVLIALVVISVGVMSIARLFPADNRSQLASRMERTAGQYANEQFELLRGVAKTTSALSTGRHPSSGYTNLGTTSAWKRYYVVTQMAAPLDSLMKIDVIVRWQSSKAESVLITGYMFP